MAFDSDPKSFRPLVSIITATFNADATLQACLESVQAQDYLNIEHILIDGASKDRTVAILKANETKIACWISEPDKGIYDAWNKGLDRARGEWIAFLGADDVLLPGAVRAYMELASQLPGAQYISSLMRWIGPNGRQRNIGKSWSWPRFQRFMTTAHVGSMHHRSLFEQYGRYDTTYRITADYEFLLRPRSSLRAFFLPEVTGIMLSGGTSDSSAALKEAARAKVETGGRPYLIAKLEYLYGFASFWARRFFDRFAS